MAEERDLGGITQYLDPKHDGFEKANSTLLDMRHVYHNDAKFDSLVSEVRVREFMDRDMKGFMAQLTTLEKKYREEQKQAKKEGGAGAGEKKLDKTTAECVEMCVKLIKELTAKGEGK